jgi:hypothetical protein
MNLSMFLTVIDGQETIRIKNYNSGRTEFEGPKFMCPFIDADVIAVYTIKEGSTAGRIIIEVA